MKLKMLLPLLATLTPLSLWAAGPDGASAQFTVSQPTMVPGMTLSPGSYTISVTDHLRDRFVLRIEGTSGDHTLFIGVPSNGLKDSSKGGVVPYDSAPDGKSAIRGFVFKSATPIEFVYPKNDAVALAKANEKKVLAVDPVSEGKSENMSSLNKDDMQMISLWTLTPEPVSGGGDPKISASKYEQQVASLTPHRPAMKSLPHTASSTPAIFLLGLLSAIGAALFARARLANAISR
jgi:LPXTG-motif cell wall-anchored protein